jgi:cytoskeletal protein CcmA (bactofilin family)
MARTQLRLDAVTGSLVAIEAAAKAAGVPASGSAEHLEDVLGHFAGALKRITGAPSFTEQEAGQFSQALTGSAGMKLGGDLNVVGMSKLGGDARAMQKLRVDGGADMKSTLFVTGAADLAAALTVAGAADFNGGVAANEIKIDGDTVGRLYLVGANGEVADSADLSFAAGKFSVSGGVDASGTVEAAAVKIDGDTAQRLYIVDADGSMKDESKLVFDGSKLTVTGNFQAVTGTFSGNLTVDGDLLIKGATTTVDTENLLVKDAKIVISSGSLVDGAGIYLADENAGENIRWSAADTKWIASDKLAADTLQALDLSSNIVWADASGNLVEITDQQLADAMEARLAAGTGVSISESGASITVAIGQPVATTDAVTFAVVTGSNLTASRLMASNGSKAMVSADLYAWVAGTANQISVADDADGSITLSLPQSIHTDADVEFDSLKLGDNVADAGKALKIGAAGEVVAAAWNEYVAIEADVGLELVQNGFKAEIGLAQDIRSSATIRFAKVELDGADNYVDSSAGGLILHAGLAGDSIVFEFDGGKTIDLGLENLSGFTATTIMGALNELKATASASSKKATHKVAGAGFAADANMAASLSANFLDEVSAANGMVFVNGQLMLSGDDYVLDAGAKTLAFKFALVADDVVVVQKA